ILFVASGIVRTPHRTEAYRSGHNEAVLKTVWGNPQGFESLPLRHFFLAIKYLNMFVTIME
ncbi:MAG: hypothetical protein IJT84_03230, partial [Clostridia bacterium]|nr:hypothetical protein [Clostridia bacterium]